MWIMEKRGGHCPSLEATNRVLGKDREPCTLISYIHIRNEISHWTDLRHQGTRSLPQHKSAIQVLPLAALS